MKSRLLGTLSLLAIGAFFLAASYTARPVQSASCTMVMGFSQTRQWFDAGFQTAAGGSDSWQRLTVNGSEVDVIANPSSAFWAAWPSGISSACTTNSLTPDRVILNISGPEQTDPQVWAADILAAVLTTRQKLGNPLIVLQPVVGGPNHADCGTRASFNHPYIDQGIALAVAADPSLVAGFSPEVGSCSHYSDDKGHLTSSGASYVAGKVGAYYAGAVAPTATPGGATATPTSAPTATPIPTATPGKTITGCRVRTTYSDGTTYSRDVSLSVCQGLE